MEITKWEYMILGIIQYEYFEFGVHGEKITKKSNYTYPGTSQGKDIRKDKARSLALKLNEIGKKGWELVTNQDGNYIFKRPAGRLPVREKPAQKNEPVG